MRSRIACPHIILMILVLLVTACSGQTTELPPIEPTPMAFTITFTADRTNLQVDECALLRWQVTGGFGVNVNDQPVDKTG